MNNFLKKIKRQVKFANPLAFKKVEKAVISKQFFRFHTLDEYIATLNNEYIYVFNTKLGKIVYFYHLKQFSRYSKLNLYFFRLIRIANCLMVLFVLTDRIAIFFENRLIFWLKIYDPLYRYENFYYDPFENYFIIQGTTMADNFSLFIVAKLFQKHRTSHYLTPNLLRLSLDYNSIYYETNMMFNHLKKEYLSIHSICILPGHKLFLYNKLEKELYYCDLLEISKIYPTTAYLEDYEYSIFKIDKSQNCLPFQAIVGVYGKVYAQAIKHHRNHLILIQERDPISEIVWEEQYALEDDKNLSYVTRNKRTERYREE